MRDPLLEGLAGVPVSGTATRAFAGFPLDQFPVAGKTGTAQVDNKADTAVFAAFGPLPAPQYAISVVLEESGFGGTAAAPVARALFDGLSGTRPLQPAGPNGLPAGEAEGLTADTGGRMTDRAPEPALMADSGASAGCPAGNAAGRARVRAPPSRPSRSSTPGHPRHGSTSTWSC